MRDSKVLVICLSSAGVLGWAGPAMAKEPEALLKEVVVSGARSERALADVPAVVDVIQGAGLDAAKVQDIRDLVRDLPNVSVKRAPQRFGAVMGSTGRDGNAGFNIRGLEGNRVLLTVDGIRVPRELSSGVFGSASFGRYYHDLGLISRVEILRGANSALYGSDGLAGMVAMTTTEPADVLKKDQTFGGRVGVRHDTENGGTGLGLTLAAQPSTTVQWLASVQTGRAKVLDNQGTNDALNSTRTTPNPQTDQDRSLLAKLVLTPSALQKHTLTLEHVDKSSEVAAYTARGTAMGVQTRNLDGTTDMVRSRLSWDGRFEIGTPWADSLRASVGFQDAQSQEVTRSDEVLLSSGQPRQRSRDVTYAEQLWQTVLQAEKTRPIGQNWGQKLVYGLDVSVATLDNLVTGTLPPSYERYPLKRFPKTRETSTALFVQSEWASEHWSFIPALRYDHYALKPQADALYPLAATSLDDAALSPKLGVIFRPADRWSVFGNLAAGFKAPSPLQLNNYFDNPTGTQPYRTIPNPELKPETSQTLEMGARGGRDRTQWEVAAFSGRYKDFIEELVAVGGAATQADPLRFQAVNRGRVKLRGFEFKGQIPMGQATVLKAAYGQTTGTDTRTGQPINSVNPAKLVLGADHQMGVWKLGTTLSHVAKKSAKAIDSTTSQFATPAHTTLDVNASWQLRPGLRLSGAIRNLTDKKYWDWTNVRGIAASSPVIDAYTAPGRSLSVALVADF